MVATGALGSLPVEFISLTFETYAQAEERSAPSSPWFTISAVTPVMAASGVAILAWMTTGSRWRRYAIISVAGMFTACVLFVLSSHFHPYSSRYVTSPVSPHGLLPTVLRVTPVLAGLTIIAAAATIIRVARPVLGIGLVRSLQLACTLAIASVIAAAANRAHALWVVRDSTLTNAWKLWGTIDAGSALMADWLARISCLVVGVGAVMAIGALCAKTDNAPSD